VAHPGKTRGDADRPPADAVSQPLALAFLALADDDSTPDQRTLPRVFTAALAAVVLAVATLSSKVSLAPDDEAG
jgi:hypothetical protein